MFAPRFPGWSVLPKRYNMYGQPRSGRKSCRNHLLFVCHRRQTVRELRCGSSTVSIRTRPFSDGIAIREKQKTKSSLRPCTQQSTLLGARSPASAGSQRRTTTPITRSPHTAPVSPRTARAASPPPPWWPIRLRWRRWWRRRRRRRCFHVLFSRSSDASDVCTAYAVTALRVSFSAAGLLRVRLPYTTVVRFWFSCWSLLLLTLVPQCGCVACACAPPSFQWETVCSVGKCTYVCALLCTLFSGGEVMREKKREKTTFENSPHTGGSSFNKNTLSLLLTSSTGQVKTRDTCSRDAMTFGETYE